MLATQVSKLASFRVSCIARRRLPTFLRIQMVSSGTAVCASNRVIVNVVCFDFIIRGNPPHNNHGKERHTNILILRQPFKVDIEVHAVTGSGRVCCDKAANIGIWGVKETGYIDNATWIARGNRGGRQCAPSGYICTAGWYRGQAQEDEADESWEHGG